MKRLALLCLPILALTASLTLTGCSDQKENKKLIRIGHFPNVTHVQSLVARNMERHGQGWFQKYLPEYTFEWYTYNAGPSAMEAIFGKSLDVTYVGPSPAINAFVKSEGKEIRILAGSAEGGAAFVIRKDKNITKPVDLIGCVVATPQLGNTQDVSCRAWLANNNFTVNMQGAIYNGPESNPTNGVDVRLLPTANPEQLPMLLRNNLDAVWTVEPWVTRLEQQAGGKVFLEEKDVVTTILVSRVKFMEENPAVIEKLVQAHKELTQWIIDNPEEAQKRVVEELENITKTKVDPALIAGAWKRLILTTTPSVPGLQKFVDDAKKTGFIKESFDVQKMIATPKADQ